MCISPGNLPRYPVRENNLDIKIFTSENSNSIPAAISTKPKIISHLANGMTTKDFQDTRLPK